MGRAIITGILILLACIVWTAIITIILGEATTLCSIGGLSIAAGIVNLRHFRY